MHSKNKPYVPPPMYPMYPEEHRTDKSKHENDEKRRCGCCKRRKKRVKSVIDVMRKGAVSRLEFWSVYGVPYLLVSQGLVSSILSPAIALMFKNDCPGLPILFPVLLGRLPVGFIDAAALFLMTAEALHWDTSYNWIGKITAKLSWRMVAGMILTLFIVWGTLLFISTNVQYTHGKPINQDPTSPHYCHVVPYMYAKIYKILMLVFIGFTVTLFLVGGVLLLCLICIVSRIRG